MARTTRLTDAELIGQFQQVTLGDEQLEALLQPDSTQIIADALEVPGRKEPLGQAEFVAVIAAGAVSGLDKVRADGQEAQLDDAERLGLESVVLLFGRPALLVEDGHFRPPKPPWEKLEDHRPAIESALRSVGRVELEGHPEYDVVGTGFLVGDDIVMTNRHVAKYFLVGPPDWSFEQGITARIDFNEEFLAGEPREFAIREVIGVSLDLDIALFRVDADDSAAGTLPPPLALADTVGAAEGADVYVIGFPLNDPDPGTNAEALHRIFSDLYGVKRVQPGKVTGFDPVRHEIVHDCSTLHGNSGSCLIELESGGVIGVHRRGRYLRGNFAVSLPDAREDPAVLKARLQFS
jgi:Trypsin-like peptidase domain